MDTQEELQKLADERDTLQKTLEDLYAEAPAEAGFSMNFQMAHPVVGNTQVTFRGARAGDALKVIEQVRTFAASVTKNGWKFNAPTPAPPPASENVVETLASNGHKELADEVRANGQAVPDAPDGKPWLTMDIARVKIVAEPNDLYTIEFYAAGHQWPDLKARKWKLDRAKELMRHATSQDVSKPADLSLNCTVYYKNGKEKANKPGDFWKDIYHVRPTK